MSTEPTAEGASPALQEKLSTLLRELPWSSNLYHPLSPALIAEYQTRLPDKTLLQSKLHEFYALNVGDGEQP